MTEKELADALGIKQPAVSKLIAQGMPGDSVENARLWRAANKDSYRANQNFRPFDGVDTPIMEIPDIVVPEDKDAYSTVERLSLAERQLAGSIEAYSNQIPMMVENRNNARSKAAIKDSEMKLSQVHLKLDSLRKEQRLAIKALQDAQAKVLKMERDRGKLITLDAAKDYVTTILSTVLIAVRKLPDQAKNEEERQRLVVVAESLLTIIRSASEEALKKQ